MRKTILTVIAATLIVAATVQNAAAAERRHVRKVAPITTSQQFSNANASLALPAVPVSPLSQRWFPDESQGSGLAGH
jgi:hypothetical protein